MTKSKRGFGRHFIAGAVLKWLKRDSETPRPVDSETETSETSETETKLARVIELTRELEIRKALYDELDKLTLELKAEGFNHKIMLGLEITLKDNFESANVQWRMAAVRRYEIKVKKLK